MKKIYLLGEVTKELETQLVDLKLKCVRTVEGNTDAHALVVRGEIPVDKSLIDKLPNLQIIASAGIGYDNINVAYARSKDIYVVNCPYANSVSTAEHSVALMLAGMRNIVKATNELKKGIWDRKNNIVVQWYGKKIGILGFGRIGRYSAQLFASIGMDVYAFDPYVPNYHFLRARVKRTKTIEELFSKVNYVSVHLPRTSKTVNLVDKKLIDLLELPNGIVNTCRGGIVKEVDIVEALEKSKLDFYAADVFDGEPKINQKLIEHTRVLATPHIAANTVDAQEQVTQDVSLQIRQVLVDHEEPSYNVDGNYL